MTDRAVLSIVVPCFNEEEVLPLSSQELWNVLNRLIVNKKIHGQSKIVFVDDGSTDQTWKLIGKLHEREPKHFSGVKLSRNFGHQKALLAGLQTVVEDSDMIVTIDADLQDDTEAICRMVDEYLSGYDIVYGVRNSRETDTVFKRQSARSFYQLMKKWGVELVPDHADFRLLSCRALKALLKFEEETPFFRGLVPLVGFPSTQVFYARKPRAAGISKYPLKKMLLFALNGITSFSLVPIKFIRNLGFLTVLIGLVYMLYTLIQRFVFLTVVPGWSSIIMSIWLLGGMQLIALSILGEYLGRVYSETKKRPRFIIEEKLSLEKGELDGED